MTRPQEFRDSTRGQVHGNRTVDMARIMPVSTRVVDATLNAAMNQTEVFIAWGRSLLALSLLARFLLTGLLQAGGGNRASLELPATVTTVIVSIWLGSHAQRRTLTPRLVTVSVILDSAFAFSSLLANVLWPWQNYDGLLRLPDVGALLVVVLVSALRPRVDSVVVGTSMATVSLLVLVSLDFKLNWSVVLYRWADVLILLLYIAAVGAVGVFSIHRTRRLAELAAQKSATIVRARRGMSSVLQDQHDLGSALMSASLNLDTSLRLLRRPQPQDEVLKGTLEFLDTDLSELKHLIRMSRDRAFAELSEALDRVPVKLAPVLEAANARASRRFPNCIITCKCEPAVFVLIQGGGASLERIIYNILINACEGDGAASANRIEIHVTAQGEFCAIRIRDNGPGVDASLCNDNDHALSSKPTGTGLGLYLCRRIVRASGGHFSIGNPPSGGCEVLLSLPVHEGPGAE